MDFDTMFNSMVEILRRHGLTTEADDAVDCWNHGEEDVGIGLCADALLQQGIKPDDDILDAYGTFAKDTADDGLSFDDADLKVYEGLKVL